MPFRRSPLLATTAARFVALLALFTLFVGGTAHACPTFDAINASFDSLNGKLTFSNLQLSGSAFAIANVTIEATDNGFDIVMHNDAMRVGPGDARDLVVQYDVVSNAGSILEASLAFEAQALGQGALATVSEDYFAEPGSVLIPPGLTVFTTPDASVFSASQSTGGQMMMSVKKDILVTSISGDLAEITRVSQAFSPIPEPGAALLFSVGFGLVATHLRRRSRLL